MRSVKRIIKIHKIKDFKIFCLFNNGESRIIDFNQLFVKWNTKKGDLEYVIMKSLKEFQKVELVDGALTWKNIRITSEDETGKAIVY